MFHIFVCCDRFSFDINLISKSLPMFNNFSSRGFKRVLIFSALFMAIGGLNVAMAMIHDLNANSECKGWVVGNTTLNSYTAPVFDDHGISYANSHSGAIDVVTSDISVATGNSTPGYAPGDSQAACVVGKGTGSGMEGLDQVISPADLPKYAPLKGYLWNTNLGFISLYCTANGSNFSSSCGAYNYGVYVGPDNSGTRTLTGYAWNSVFGYMNFGQSGANPGVSAVKDSSSGLWKLSGYAWTQAGVYVKMTGLSLQIEDEVCELGIPPYPCCGSNQPPLCGYCSAYPTDTCCTAPGANSFECGCSNDPNQSCCAVNPGLPDCQKTPYWCEASSHAKNEVCVEVTPSSVLSGVGFDKLPVANGTNGYGFRVYVYGADGKTPRTLAANEQIKVSFDWTDTVKLDQLAKNNQVAGAVTKPTSSITINSSFIPVDGAYTFKPTPATPPVPDVTSYAPTSGGNSSRLETSATLFPNDVFYGTSIKDSLEQTQKNELILNGVTYQYSSDNGATFSPARVIHPNTGKPLPLYFRPLFEVSRLFTNDLKDAISGIRDLPITINVAPGFNNGPYYSISPTIGLSFIYDKNLNTAQCSSAAYPFSFKFSNSGDWTGGTSCNAGSSYSCNYTKAVSLTNANTSFVGYFPYFSKSTSGTSFSDMPIANILTAIATLPTVAGNTYPLCYSMPSPTLYTTISYTNSGKVISYYSNKLPRLNNGILSNPTAQITGNIYSSLQFSPDVEQKIMSSGEKVSSEVRDAVAWNVENYVKKYVKAKNMLYILNNTTKNTCSMSVDNLALGCSMNSSDFFPVASDEQAIYFKKADVSLNPGGTLTYGKRLIVVEGGNLFINTDLNGGTSESPGQVVIVVLKATGDTGGTGNVYLSDSVRTLKNVLIVADGAVFPVPSSFNIENDVNTTTGELSNPAPKDFFNGTHKDSAQLYMSGAIWSRNEISLTGMNKTGTFESAGGDIYRSMMYDWNFLRLYKGGSFQGSFGSYMDFSCGRELTPDDVLSIQNGDAVYGVPVSAVSDYSPKVLCSVDGLANEGDTELSCKCDGLQESVYPKGDLIPDESKVSPLARGIKPFYLNYVPISSVVTKIDSVQ